MAEQEDDFSAKFGRCCDPCAGRAIARALKSTESCPRCRSRAPGPLGGPGSRTVDLCQAPAEIDTREKDPDLPSQGRARSFAHRRREVGAKRGGGRPGGHSDCRAQTASRRARRHLGRRAKARLDRARQRLRRRKLPDATSLAIMKRARIKLAYAFAAGARGTIGPHAAIGAVRNISKASRGQGTIAYA